MKKVSKTGKVQHADKETIPVHRDLYLIALFQRYYFVSHKKEGMEP